MAVNERTLGTITLSYFQDLEKLKLNSMFRMQFQGVIHGNSDASNSGKRAHKNIRNVI